MLNQHESSGFCASTPEFGASARYNPNDSYSTIATRSLHRLCSAVGFSRADRAASVATLEQMLHPWGRRAVGTGPAGESDITDEHFPIEFSLALENGVPEVRVLLEAQPVLFNQRGLWRAAWQSCEQLEQQHGVSLARLRAIADLYEPTSAQCRYAMWHGVGFAPGRKPQFKVYVNPLAQGPERGAEVVSETLTRLGFGRALHGVLGEHRHGSEFRFLSLDLEADPTARLKVYRVHHDSTRAEIESWLRVVPGYDHAGLDRFWSTIAGSNTRFTGMPISTYVSLDSRSAMPTSGTIHFPVRSYASDDLEVQERLRAFLTPEEFQTYETALSAFATRPLDAGIGLHSYVSVRLHQGKRHVTFYLSPEVYEVAPARRMIKLAV